MTKPADPLDRIDQGCYLALRFMLRPFATFTDCLEIVQGCYVFRKDAESYHPLEAALVAEDAGSGDWLTDVAMVLGVSAEWIVGFCDGFAQAGEADDEPDYIQGYLAAEELLQRHPELGRWVEEGRITGTKG